MNMCSGRGLKTAELADLKGSSFNEGNDKRLAPLERQCLLGTSTDRNWPYSCFLQVQLHFAARKVNTKKLAQAVAVVINQQDG